MKRLLFFAALSVSSFCFTMQERTPYVVGITLAKKHFKTRAIEILRLKFWDKLEHEDNAVSDRNLLIVVNASKSEILKKLHDEKWAHNVTVAPMLRGNLGERVPFLDQDPSAMSERMREYVQDYKTTYGE